MAAKYSKLNRIYYQDEMSIGQRLAISGDKFNYFKNVLRCKIGEEFRIFNESSGEFKANILEMGRREVVIEIAELLRPVRPEPQLILAMAMIKPDRMLEAIKAAVQLGVTKIIPLKTEFVQKSELNRERVMRCILEATEQCERLVPPELCKVQGLDELLEESDGQVIWADEGAEVGVSLSSVIVSSSSFIPGSSSFIQRPTILIGPEGGFSEQERKKLLQAGDVIPVSLGVNVLRAEVAAIALLAIVNEVRRSGKF